MRVATGPEAVAAFKKIRFKHRLKNARYGPLQ
jgi:hypothetical protein